jgi:hypothetical protein
MLRPESWAVIGAAVVGIVAAVMAFLKTPPERRFRVMRPDLEQQRVQCPPDERAVIIRADRARAFRRDLPWLLLTLPMAAFAMWWSATDGEACASLFGVGRPRLATFLVLTVVPFTIVLTMGLSLWQARAVLRGGYWPPLDTPLYQDALARGGAVARRRAWALIALALLILGVLAAGYPGLLRFFTTTQAWERMELAEARCLRAP